MNTPLAHQEPSSTINVRAWAASARAAARSSKRVSRVAHQLFEDAPPCIRSPGPAYSAQAPIQNGSLTLQQNIRKSGAAQLDPTRGRQLLHVTKDQRTARLGHDNANEILDHVAMQRLASARARARARARASIGGALPQRAMADHLIRIDAALQRLDAIEQSEEAQQKTSAQHGLHEVKANVPHLEPLESGEARQMSPVECGLTEVTRSHFDSHDGSRDAHQTTVAPHRSNAYEKSLEMTQTIFHPYSIRDCPTEIEGGLHRLEALEKSEVVMHVSLAQQVSLEMSRAIFQPYDCLFNSAWSY